MILIPGLASSGEVWATTVARLRDRYTCHVLTLAGFAGVPPVAGPLLPAVRAELAAYITAHRLERPVIAGHSLGGATALAFAAERPELAGPLVIVDAVPFLAGVMGATTLDQARASAAQLRAALDAMPPAQRDEMTRGSAHSMVTSAADRARVIAWGQASDPATVTAAMIDLMTTDLRPALPRIQVPVLVIGSWVGWGTPPDRAATTARFRAQYASLPRLHFAMAPAARHFVMLDDLPWFLGEVERFLADPAAAVRDRGFPASPV